jgi:hypothetical protein
LIISRKRRDEMRSACNTQEKEEKLLKKITGNPEWKRKFGRPKS